MNIRKALFMFVMVGLLSSCASFSDYKMSEYHHDDASEKQFLRESAECEMEGEKKRTTDGMGGLAGIASYHESYNRVYDACMRSKGYIRKAE